MPGLKRHDPGIRFSNILVTPEEMDRYEQYVISFPSIADDWFGTRKSGTADVKALTLTNVIADYPRNVEFMIEGSATGMAGTLALYGTDQFGGSVSESLGFGSADNGGTVVGTKIFAQISAGTVSFGTFAGANGTAQLGVGTTGTTCLFGLPDKIGGTKDVKAITRSTAGGAQTVGGGTIAAFVGTQYHHIKCPADLTGTQIITVLYKSTYDTDYEVKNRMANLSQRV